VRFLRGLLGVLLWLVASVVGLLGVVCCVTLILLPVGFLLLRVAGRSYRRSVALMLPRAVSHPADEAAKGSSGFLQRSADAVKPSERTRKKMRKTGSKAGRKAKDLVADAGKSTGLKKRRRVLGIF
jgi:hypothetical protein